MSHNTMNRLSTFYTERLVLEKDWVFSALARKLNIGFDKQELM